MANSYNGYANYATWNVCLWMDNDYELYQRKIAMLRSTSVLDADIAERIAMDVLGKCSTPDLSEDEEGARWCDVDWAEIAESWTEEIREHEGD